MLGLLGVGLGIYGAYALKKDAEYTKKDLNIPKGVGTILEQKNNIDKNFIDILEYGGAKCKIKKDMSRRSQYKRGNIHYKIIDAQPYQYGGMGLYLMQKGYCQEAIQYAKDKFDRIAKQQEQNKTTQIKKSIRDFEDALKYQEVKELAVSFQINGYKTSSMIKKENEKVIEYLHTHGNPTARVNVIIGGTTPTYDFDVTWVFFAPVGYDPHDYILNIQKII